MKKFMMSVPEKMQEDLKKERDLRRLDSIQETIRQILSEFLKRRDVNGSK